MKRTFRVAVLIRCTSEDGIEQIEEEYAIRAAIAQLLRNRGNEFAIQEPRDVESEERANGLYTGSPVLDVACGGKMFYFDKFDPRVLFCDIRKVDTTLCDGRKFAVNPDVICDFTNLPFQDEQFSMVVFDPPHLIRNTGKSKSADMYGSLNHKATPTGYQQIKYGALYTDWRDMLRKGFAECFRVLKQGGFLVFKWNETDIKVSEILELTPEKPMFGNRSGKSSKTHWMCFMKNTICVEREERE